MTDAEAPFLAGADADDDQSPLAGVSDFRGRPVRRDTSGGWRSALFVVGTSSSVSPPNRQASANLS
jgi:peptide/histidine transporter 3/4